MLIQGITGPTGASFAERMLRGGTRLVAGVTPGKAGQSVHSIPVFGSVEDAVSASGANVAFCAVGAGNAKNAAVEAVASGIDLVVIYTEGVPVRDALEICAQARLHGARILGPNSAGIVVPNVANASDLNDETLQAGGVGIVSKSGTLTYEALLSLYSVGMGASAVVCLGGDPVVGTSFGSVLEAFAGDEDTEAIVAMGEPGGVMEYEILTSAGDLDKPIIAYFAARNAPQGKQLGHAGAIIGDDTRTSASAKARSFVQAGIPVAELVTDIGALVKHTML